MDMLESDHAIKLLEEYEERAAIREFDGGFGRDEAEKLARIECGLGDSPDTDGCVYFICDEDMTSVKIGWTSNLPKRLKQIQTTSPFPVFRLAAIKNSSRATETSLHQQYRHLKTHGEWFRFRSKDLIRRLLTMPHWFPEGVYQIFSQWVIDQEILKNE